MSTPAHDLPDEMDSATGLVASFVSNLREEAIPQSAVTVAHHCLLDWIGVSIAGANDETVRIVREEALEQGGAEQASVIGGPGRLSVMQAALINGTAGHALDYDDVHRYMPGHPTAPVAPAVLALAERNRRSGRDVITAFIAGVEAECRIGRYLGGSHYELGWHATATIGTFGAAAGAARLLGFDMPQTALALGVAGTQAAGLKSMFGTMCKPLHAGKAAANGLHAALLIARGFTSRTDVLECAQGFGATQSNSCDTQALEYIGDEFLTRNILFKYHAACHGTHSTIEAARSLVERQNVTISAIDHVEIRIQARYLKMCNIQQPRTGLEAKFSLRMTCAMALAGVSTSDPARYNESLCSIPELKALTARITVNESDELGPATSEIIVSLNNGVVYRVHGDVSQPAQDLDEQGRRLREKFDSLVEPVLGVSACNDLADMTEHLGELQDIRSLMAMTRA